MIPKSNLNIQELHKLTGETSNTPVVEKEGIFFKREDMNPTGSLKDRGLAYQISKAKSEGVREAVISSSGNAAISASAYCRKAGINLHVFVSPKISKGKLKEIEKYDAKVHFDPRPVSSSIKFSKEKNILNLRPSVTEDGWVGYQAISFELDRELGKIDSIFVPVSSGTSLVGIAYGFEKLGYLPQIHLVQTTAVCPIAAMFDKDYSPTSWSKADALVAKSVPRKSEILNFIKKSNGSGWVISDIKIDKAQEMLKFWGIETSAEGAASLAAIFKAKEKGKDLGEKIVCLLTGKKYE